MAITRVAHRISHIAMAMLN